MPTTLWSPKGLLSLPAEDRVLALQIGPLVYGTNLLIYLIFGTVNGGSKVMQAYLGTWGTLSLTLLIGLSSLLALIGLAFLHPHMERAAATVMATGSVLYLVLLFFALGNGSSPVSTMAGTIVTTAITMVKVRRISLRIGHLKRPLA